FPLAALVYKSGFLPRLIGVWLAVAGVAWVAFSFTRIVAPQYDWVLDKVFNPASFGEIVFMFWLLIRGAKELPAHSPDHREGGWVLRGVTPSVHPNPEGSQNDHVCGSALSGLIVSAA